MKHITEQFAQVIQPIYMVSEPAMIPSNNLFLVVTHSSQFSPAFALFTLDCYCPVPLLEHVPRNCVQRVPIRVTQKSDRRMTSHALSRATRLSGVSSHTPTREGSSAAVRPEPVDVLFSIGFWCQFAASTFLG